VGLGVGVDGSPDLRDPELNTVVREHWESQAVLVAVERSLRLANYYRVKTTLWILQCLQERGRLRAAFPRDRPGLPDIEVLGHHLAVSLDQRPRSSQLPVPRCLRILLIFRGYSPVERELGHQAAPLPSS
jgi:hypothetical protein